MNPASGFPFSHSLEYIRLALLARQTVLPFEKQAFGSHFLDNPCNLYFAVWHSSQRTFTTSYVYSIVALIARMKIRFAKILRHFIAGI
jgi:hypothetical protein